MDGILIFSYGKSNAHSLTTTPHFKKSYAVRTYSEPIDPVLVFAVYLLLILCGIWGFFINIIIQSQISQFVSKILMLILGAGSQFITLFVCVLTMAYMGMFNVHRCVLTRQ